MIKISQKGDFSKLSLYLKKSNDLMQSIDFDKYGKMGVSALSSATPIDSGVTANSWYYEVIQGKEQTEIAFGNTNIQSGVPIAIILQYGHATKNGGWVQGRDYINPAIQPIFDEIINSVWKEVTKL